MRRRRHARWNAPDDHLHNRAILVINPLVEEQLGLHLRRILSPPGTYGVKGHNRKPVKEAVYAGASTPFSLAASFCAALARWNAGRSRNPP
jgi:hypothetical protein